MRRLALFAAALALAVVPAASADTDTSKLREKITVKAIMKHLKTLEGIADANGGTRASGTTLRSSRSSRQDSSSASRRVSRHSSREPTSTS
jgi:hypothetical protein